MGGVSSTTVTVHGTVEFEGGQDIVKAWKNDELLFGLNWEKEKMRFKKLIIPGEDDVSMEIAEEPGRGLRYEDTGGFVVSYTPPIPDHGGGGVSDADEWAHLLNPQSKDTDGDRMPDNYEVEYGKYRGGWQDPHRYNERYALIIIGGGWNDPYEVDASTYMEAFWNDGKAMYDKLVRDYKYRKENVYLMSSRWYSKYDGSWGVERA